MNSKDYAEREIRNLQHSSLPLREKLASIDIDLISLKLTDTEVKKEVRRLHGLVKFQVMVLTINIILSTIIIYVLIEGVLNGN